MFSFVRIMSLLRPFKSLLDLPQVLQFLRGVGSKSEKHNSSLFQQEDAGEILRCSFDKFCVGSLHAQHM